MKTPAYVQQKNGKYANVNFYQAALALDRFFSYEVVPFEAADVDNLPITKDTPVYAGIAVFEKVIKKLGRTALVPYWPLELNRFLGRKVDKVTVGELTRMVEGGQEIFVKPLEVTRKSFTGTVMRNRFGLLHVAELPLEAEVYTSEVVKFVTEYRCFIHKEAGVFGAKHYAGDWKLIPDLKLAEVAMKEYTQSPIAYSLDLGLTEDGRTLLVECNDATSLGCYGLDAYAYGKMITDRWAEIMK